MTELNGMHEKQDHLRITLVTNILIKEEKQQQSRILFNALTLTDTF